MVAGGQGQISQRREAAVRAVSVVQGGPCVLVQDGALSYSSYLHD